jgi:hypothetical protein
MGGATGFVWLRLRHDRDSAEQLRAGLAGSWESSIARHGAGVWGAFAGHFGVDSRDVLYIVSQPRRQEAPVSALTSLLPGGVVAEEALSLLPTIRPADNRPLERGGLYVHRFFETGVEHVDEMVNLSGEAWRTFEASERYSSRPMGLFREASPSGRITRLLLVTWYDGFASWQESRNFPPEAARNFRRRSELTRSTLALATRLVPRSRG